MITQEEFNQLSQVYLAEMEKLKARKPLCWTLTPVEALMLVGQLQLALRHEQNTGPSAQVARRLTEELIRAVAPDGSTLRTLLDLGWSPHYDVEQANQ